MSDFSGKPQKMFVWSGGNKFSLNPKLDEAAIQREEIRKAQEEWQKERIKEGQIKGLLAKLLRKLQ